MKLLFNQGVLNFRRAFAGLLLTMYSNISPLIYLLSRAPRFVILIESSQSVCLLSRKVLNHGARLKIRNDILVYIIVQNLYSVLDF